MQFIKDFLCGAKAVVSCLDASPASRVYPEPLVAAGTEDGTVHIWTMAQQTPTHTLRVSETDEITSLRFHPTTPLLFVAAGRHLHAFDLTNGRAVSDDSDASQPWQDDIESIHIHASGRYIATADDTGAVMVCEYQLNPTKSRVVITSVQRFRGHTHANIATAVRFRPTKPWECISIGMDCQLMHWDFAMKRMMSVMELESTPDDGKMLNPPLMHALEISPNGHLMAVALGDGSVLVMTPQRKAKRLCEWTRARLSNQHSCAATNMYFSLERAFF
jgi:WD40 repeat protein